MYNIPHFSDFINTFSEKYIQAKKTASVRLKTATTGGILYVLT